MGFGRVGVLYNGRIPQAPSLAAEIETWISHQHVEKVHVCSIEETRDSLRLPELDLVLAAGGDGSILQAARLAAPHRVPILGVNLGRVGFLTEAETDGWKAVLERVLIGDYWVEERIMLAVSASRGDAVIGEGYALNDAVVGRRDRGGAVHLRAEVDGGELATYVADGLIVATPTGSTAYALAAGGPILPPQLRNILLVPVAPHLSMDRPIVLAEGATVQITVVGRRPAVLMADGQVTADLENLDTVNVEVSPHVARFARVRERTYFYKTLASRLVPRNDR
jgi:NAD+ kinase